MFKCPDLGNSKESKKMIERWTLETNNLDSWLLKKQSTVENEMKYFTIHENKTIYLDNFFLILIYRVNSLDSI